LLLAPALGRSLADLDAQHDEPTVPWWDCHMLRAPLRFAETDAQPASWLQRFEAVLPSVEGASRMNGAVIFAPYGRPGLVAQWLGWPERHGFDPASMLRKDNFAAFCIAAGSGHLPTLMSVLSLAEQHDVSVADMLRANGFMPFKDAAYVGDISILRWIVTLAERHDVAVFDMLRIYNFLPITAAARNGRFAACEWLLSLGEQHGFAVTEMLRDSLHSATSRSCFGDQAASALPKPCLAPTRPYGVQARSGPGRQ
jgi:hypothetical protein